ncbi:hypothetical protein TRAPUB_6932 [Trametes pubescens]|uniref:HORMA domain-containing protein n=1 Tax=Trametes pubescens TaxID=154538 RepID=A0A1M2V4I0_TRAPU|nr:hypothetical protein TRAPUB_6932 [Trametes pubescens]
MSLGEDMMNLSLSGSKDPVADATLKGKVPTLGEVKRSLKALIKNLIQATTQMDALPKRRFATFKLYYYENTPEDYEPPHFRAGDMKKDKWFMTTHNKGEIPERCSVGSVQTGYHGVDVKVTSVSGYLPSAEDNNAPFLGTTSGNPFGAPPLTPAEEASMRAQQIEIQREDALERRVVWDTDIELADMNGSEGEEHSALAKSRASAPERVVPVGFRNDEGTIIPYAEPETPRRFDKNAEAQYAGKPESVPMCIGQLAKSRSQDRDDVSPTQEIEGTQVVPSPPTSAPASPLGSRSQTPTPKPRDSHRRDNASRAESLLPPSDIEPSLSMDFQTAESLDTQLLKDIITGGATETQENSMILDMESQREAELPGTQDPIQSFTDASAQSGVDIVMDNESTTVMDCECGVLVRVVAPTSDFYG